MTTPPPPPPPTVEPTVEPTAERTPETVQGERPDRPDRPTVTVNADGSLSIDWADVADAHSSGPHVVVALRGPTLIERRWLSNSEDGY